MGQSIITPSLDYNITWACKLAGMVDQTEGHNFSMKGRKKKTKFQLVKQDAQLFINKLFMVKEGSA